MGEDRRGQIEVFQESPENARLETLIGGIRTTSSTDKQSPSAQSRARRLRSLHNQLNSPFEKKNCPTHIKLADTTSERPSRNVGLERTGTPSNRSFRLVGGRTWSFGSLGGGDCATHLCTVLAVASLSISSPLFS